MNRALASSAKPNAHVVFSTHRRMIIVAGTFGLNRRLAVGKKAKGQKLKANSQ